MIGVRGEPSRGPLTPHLPADDYERRLAERRKRASRAVVGFYLLTIVPYLASWVVGLWPGSPPWAFGIAVSAATGCAMVTGIVALRNWSLLSWEMRLFGLAPWAFFALTTFPWLIMAMLL